MENIKIKNVNLMNLDYAIDCLRHFSITYPHRMGISNGCAYTKDRQAFYVYRLKTMLVVVGQ